MFPTLLREGLGRRRFSRQPEPGLVMDDAEQVAAYVEAGRIDGVMAAAYLFHTARASQVLQGCRRVLDLGCGPATQLAQVALCNPEINFIGVDLSQEMLGQAERHVRDLGLDNVEFCQDDVTRLERMAEGSADGVISTMALHHLPTLNHLRACFHRVGRLLKPGGALYIVDFGRLKSLKSVHYFAGLNEARQPRLFTQDYEQSMCAAFLAQDFQDLAAEALALHRARVYTTFIIPMLVIVKTADRPLPAALRERFKDMRQALPTRYRRDLDEIRQFLRLGGLGNDPFS
jgi:ubiquinone/menaquinone biosynthesis C-methylase UbiE